MKKSSRPSFPTLNQFLTGLAIALSVILICIGTYATLTEQKRIVDTFAFFIAGLSLFLSFLKTFPSTTTHLKQSWRINIGIAVIFLLLATISGIVYQIMTNPSPHIPSTTQMVGSSPTPTIPLSDSAPAIDSSDKGDTAAIFTLMRNLCKLMLINDYQKIFNALTTKGYKAGNTDAEADFSYQQYGGLTKCINPTLAYIVVPTAFGTDCFVHLHGLQGQDTNHEYILKKDNGEWKIDSEASISNPAYKVLIPQCGNFP